MSSGQTGTGGGCSGRKLAFPRRPGRGSRGAVWHQAFTLSKQVARVHHSKPQAHGLSVTAFSVESLGVPVGC